MALGGRVEAVDRLRRDLDGGVEAEGAVGAGEVVVDGLGDADDRQLPRQLVGGVERAVAADGDEAVEASAP